MISRRTVIFLSLMLIWNIVLGNNKTITKQEAIEDIWSLKVTLEEVHPNLYYSISEKEINKEFELLISKLGSNVDCNWFAAQLAPIIEKLRDGHTGINPLIKNKKDEPKAFFPLKVDLRNYTVITDNDAGIRKGARLISIDSIMIEDLIKKILPNVFGEKEEFKLSFLEYELPYYLWRFAGLNGEFNVKYSDNGVVSEKSILGKPQRAFYYRYKTKVQGEFDICKIEDAQYGYLKLSEFGYSRSYNKLFKDCFQQLLVKKIDNLIIDLRDNAGGNSIIANKLMQYIAKSQYTFFDSIIYKYSKPTKHFYRTFGLKRPYILPFLMLSPGFWKDNGTDKSEDIKQVIYISDEYRFSGQVYLITSNYCFSTADDFARSFKYYKMGIIIGEETGGMKDSFGDTMTFKLPNSKIECDCSHNIYKGLDLNDKYNDGVKPDIMVDCKYYSKEEIVKYIHSLNLEY